MQPLSFVVTILDVQCLTYLDALRLIDLLKFMPLMARSRSRNLRRSTSLPYVPCLTHRKSICKPQDNLSQLKSRMSAFQMFIL
jgi:hypothetical protein